MPPSTVFEDIEIAEECVEGMDYGKERNEAGEVLEYPADWTMKILANHVIKTITEFDYVLEFCRLGVSDFDEMEFTLEWIYETFNDVERHRRFYLRDNKDTESEAILDDKLKELLVMFEEGRFYYRKRGRTLRRLGQKVRIKF